MSRAIRLKGRIGQPAAAETPSSRVRGFDPGLPTLDGPWWGTADETATLDNTDGQLSGAQQHWSTIPPDAQTVVVPISQAKQHIEGLSPGSLCACGHKRHAHTRSGLTANSRSWCTLCDCKEYKYGIQAKLEIAAKNFTTSMASFGGMASSASKQAQAFNAAMEGVQATLAAHEKQAFLHGAPVPPKTDRALKLMDIATKMAAQTGQSLQDVIKGMQMLGVFDE
jgi:hypothetical protein